MQQLFRDELLLFFGHEAGLMFGPWPLNDGLLVAFGH